MSDFSLGILMATHKIEALVTGTVWKLERQAGDRVASGDIIMILESMKMEIPIEAPADGVLKEVRVAEGDSVAEGEVLALLMAG